MRSGYHGEMWGGGIYSENLARAINQNLRAEELCDFTTVEALRRDMVMSYLNMGIIPEEYFVFDFRHKSISERREYLSNQMKDKILIQRIGWEKIGRLRDKYMLYSLLPDLFGRDICRVESEDDRENYCSFILRHPDYFAKPVDGMCGRGTGIYHGDCFEELLSRGRWVLEEIILQDKRLAEFNQSSVNTVRLPTFFKDGCFEAFAPFFRTGRAGSIVDNGAAGGVFAAIDAANGCIISDGFDEANHSYDVHPDSGKRFNGFVIPQWGDLISAAKDAHSRLADQQYIAWDFALTPKGWILVEANSMGQFLWQYATKRGVKKRFMELMK